ncbi:Ankyrin repeat domain [Chlorella sorokiniana]|uniref:Ankyrin repeat domain n=1 Tax=Chlorella sorokiniana TaxID=3076 RepID=A0A2P6TLD0_CHLSO|nr:Ankyrin repeat domain [Chlorella sorokiniana]|eukprot:PRW45093.1 Ankyrin repeat domain [Chlorella sorokiniana]
MAQPAALSYSPAGSPNHFEISPLAFAAWRGDGACVAALLELPEARRELHLRDKEGWSVLHFAVRGGSPVCIRLLAQAGADVRAAVPGGQQAIHWAAAAASADCCAELLLAGALPTAPDSTGRTAVQLAQRRLQHEQAAEEQAPFQRQRLLRAQQHLTVRLAPAARPAAAPCAERR